MDFDSIAALSARHGRRLSLMLAALACVVAQGGATAKTVVPDERTAARAVDGRNCVCTVCTPRHLALGTCHVRAPAGKSRAERRAGEMHHANVNLDGAAGDPVRPREPESMCHAFPVQYRD